MLVPAHAGGALHRNSCYFRSLAMWVKDLQRFLSGLLLETDLFGQFLCNRNAFGGSYTLRLQGMTFKTSVPLHMPCLEQGDSRLLFAIQRYIAAWDALLSHLSRCGGFLSSVLAFSSLVQKDMLICSESAQQDLCLGDLFFSARSQSSSTWHQQFLHEITPQVQKQALMILRGSQLRERDRERE